MNQADVQVLRSKTDSQITIHNTRRKGVALRLVDGFRDWFCHRGQYARKDEDEDACFETQKYRD